jgi:hypothetical protein
MSIESKEKESDSNKTEEREVIVVPEGTFASTIEKPILVNEGQPIPKDTGDQGGGRIDVLEVS